MLDQPPPPPPPPPANLDIAIQAIQALSARFDALAVDVASLRAQTQYSTNGSSGHRTPPPPPPPPPPSGNHRTPPPPPPPLPPQNNNHQPQPQERPRPHMKLGVPKFDGNDALGWIFKINHFFDFHHTLEHERLSIASFYMEGPALSWFQWIVKNALILSWSDFLLNLETRFAPSFYDDPKGALFKLQQTGSVNDYFHNFERLANRVVGLPHPFLLSCFISGLSPEIKREVQAFQPISLPHASALAKIQEDKINDRRRQFKPKSTHHTQPSTSHTTIANPSPTTPNPPPN